MSTPISDWAQKAARDAYDRYANGEGGDVRDCIAIALMAEREAADERAAKIAERDADWTVFQRHSKKDWKTGDEKNVFAPPSEPDDTMPTDFNVFAYRMGIAAGRTIASAIRDRSRT